MNAGTNEILILKFETFKSCFIFYKFTFFSNPFNNTYAQRE